MMLADKSAPLIRKIEMAGIMMVAVLLLYRILVDTKLDFFLLIVITLQAIFYLWSGFFLFTNANPLDILDRKKRATYTSFRIVSSIIMGIVYSIVFITLLYAIFFYPRMQFMLGFSLFLIGVSSGFIGVYLWLNRKEWGYVRQFFTRSAIFGAVIFLIMALPVETRLEVLYRKHPEFIESYMDYRANPDSLQTLDRLRDERSRFR